MSNNAHDLSKRLLNALDNNYNVVDMHTVNEIISVLEKINITKELLETTRLGKHVNELRRRTADPTLARRAKVLVKRWRDLVIPTVTASPGHGGVAVSGAAAERASRRLGGGGGGGGGGTPLTSPALTRHVMSPAVPSPKPASRPAWGGYESDSQDVILVEDDAPPPPVINTPSKRRISPVKTTPDEKKVKRDKKPKKRKEAGWGGRNGSASGNGLRPAVDIAALARGKKVKTTQELLEEIQSRRAASPASPDVMLIEPDAPVVKVESPVRNGVPSASPVPPPAPAPSLPLEPVRDWLECTCGEEEAEPNCPAACDLTVAPVHVRALHHALLPGINGTRAPTHPHQYAVRKPTDLENDELFNSVVPLYKYSDYADDYCVKNMSRVPVCTHLSWREFAPDPPDERPVVKEIIWKAEDSIEDAKLEEDSIEDTKTKVKAEEDSIEDTKLDDTEVNMEIEDTIDRLQPDIEDKNTKCVVKSDNLEDSVTKMEVDTDFVSEQQTHRTVERTKDPSLDGRTLYELCEKARSVIKYDYTQTSSAPIVTLPLVVDKAEEVLEEALTTAEKETELDALGKPARHSNFTEWHECAKLGDLIALPYVVID